MKTIITQLVAMQFPIVFLLVIQNYRMYNLFNQRAFKYISIGWLFNLLYLFFHNYGYDISSFLQISFNLEQVAVFAVFTSSSLFWYGAHKGRGLKFVNKYSRIKFVLFCLSVFLWVEISSSIISKPLYPYVAIYSIPDVFFDFFALLAYAKFSKQFLMSNLFHDYEGKKNLYFGVLLYSIMQPIFLFTVGFNPTFCDTVNTIGFFVGFIAKIFIYLGMGSFLTNYVADIKKNSAEINIAKSTFQRIAHELGTPISEISVNMHSLFERIPQKFVHNLSIIENATERIRAIMEACQDIKLLENKLSDTFKELAYKREKSYESLNKLIQIAVMAVKETRSEKIYWEIQYSRGMSIFCFKNEIAQVYINILRNAIDAFNKKTGLEYKGNIIIQTNKIIKNDIVFIQSIIKDTGHGINPDILGNIFLEGFSTRGGSGRGHGLFLVKKFLAENDGSINISNIETNSEISGCHVEILFPLKKKSN